MSVTVNNTNSPNTWNVQINQGLTVYTGNITCDNFPKSISSEKYRQIIVAGAEGFNREPKPYYPDSVFPQISSELVENITVDTLEYEWVITIKLVTPYLTHEEKIIVPLKAEPADPKVISEQYEAKFEKLESKYSELEAKYQAECNQVAKLRTELEAKKSEVQGLKMRLQVLEAENKTHGPGFNRLVDKHFGPAESKTNTNPNPNSLVSDSFLERYKQAIRESNQSDRSSNGLVGAQPSSTSSSSALPKPSLQDFITKYASTQAEPTVENFVQELRKEYGSPRPNNIGMTILDLIGNIMDGMEAAQAQPK
jgi:hypothetical protein